MELYTQNIDTFLVTVYYFIHDKPFHSFKFVFIT